MCGCYVWRVRVACALCVCTGCALCVRCVCNVCAVCVVCVVCGVVYAVCERDVHVVCALYVRVV